eukprot:scaffold4419_cov416-Prasinococcus_capsulatus_cf.AAC.1
MWSGRPRPGAFTHVARRKVEQSHASKALAVMYPTGLHTGAPRGPQTADVLGSWATGACVPQTSPRWCIRTAAQSRWASRCGTVPSLAFGKAEVLSPTAMNQPPETASLTLARMDVSYLLTGHGGGPRWVTNPNPPRWLPRSREACPRTWSRSAFFGESVRRVASTHRQLA